MTKKKEKNHLTEEQVEVIVNQSYKVYSALADTLTTADQLRILLNKKNVPEGDANRLWLAIKARYDIQSTDATKERLWELFNGMKMKIGEDFKAYKGKVEEAVANLCTVNEDVPEARIKAKLIGGLTTRYSPFVGALYAQDHTQVSIVQLCKKINDYEESNVFKTYADGPAEEKQGFVGMVKDDNKRKINDHNKKKKECYHCHKTGHFAADCYSNKNKDKKCNKCHKVGHIESDCYTKKNCSKCNKVGHTTNECYRNKNNNNNNNNNDNNKKESDTEYGNYFLPVLNQEVSNNTWILDSGASKHVCTNKGIMNNLQQLTNSITMKCANKQAVQLKETGTVKLKIINGSKQVDVTLQEVAHAPVFQCNIISVGMLVKAGLKVIFGEKGAIAFDNKRRAVITAKKLGNLFIVSVVETDEHVNVATEEEKKSKDDDDESELWHQRLGHMSYHGIKKIISMKSVNGLSLKEIQIDKTKCIDCMNGKQHRHPFNHQWNDKAEGVMVRAHADAAGPIDEDREGNKYLSGITDEKSKMFFGELVAKKSDIPNGVIKWCNSAKTYHGKTLVEFHIDGAGEYKGKEMKQYFDNEGIRVTTTLPSTPQHNLIAERMNRTIFGSARSMLSHLLEFMGKKWSIL